MDCAEAVKLSGEKDISCSSYRNLLQVFQELINEDREVTKCKISRYKYDLLANMSRISGITNCWLGDYPHELVNVMNKNCISND